ncbi:Dynein heavy chain family protein [Tritrichomonas foetus]|uniref:Dynein heavy chain family protein n=1 Tax=Tritrichomonas foetus TaxID=1144522 RepID=A0A1J4KD20_9EUKA|nr:Dynein heavy chain family protein [Tritrichomonas foetus]|eukprot:OHT09327.1 Dynein heavy chain family protein [Tritrichomonas foetus]
MSDSRLKYIYSKIAENLGFTKADPVEDWAMKLQQNDLSKITSFFEADGPPAVFFYTLSRDPLRMKVSIDPQEYPGENCIFVPYILRIESDKNGVSQSNIDSTIVCGVVHGDPVESFYRMFTDTYLPAVQTTLDQSEENFDRKEANILLKSIERKSETVAASVFSTKKAIQFEPPQSMFDVTTDSSSILAASRDDSITSKFSMQCKVWCTQIQNLLSVTEQVRQEDETSGPRAEMDYWRERMSIFSSLVDSLKGDEMHTVISVLKAAKHPVLTLWNDLDCKITESANEAKDNVKFLSSLEKYTEMFYALDPPECEDLIPGLITSVSMVHNISRYYRTPHRICTFLKKVTNQMINRCCSYIQMGGLLYEQERQQLIDKFNACIKLNQTYQRIYDGTMKKKVPNQTDKGGSERELRTHFIIFGKFDAFSNRCKVLVDLFSTIDQFHNLKNCKVEGMASIVANFIENVDFTVRCKDSIMLDPRNKYFDEQFRIFKEQCGEKDKQIRKLLANAFQVTQTVKEAIELHETLRETMTREEGKLELDIWFKKTLQRFEEDVTNVRTWFTQQADNPPIPKNMPPLAGKITWIRQLISRINEPMNIFTKYDESYLKRISTSYNKALYHFMLYETKKYNEFTDAANALKKEMQNTLLKMDPNTHTLSVNFSLDVMRVFQEAAVLKRLGFELPEGFDTFLAREHQLKVVRAELSNLVVRYDNILYMISESFEDLFSDAKNQLDEVIAPAGKTLTWTSLSLDQFINSVKSKIVLLEEALNKVNDIRIFSINKALKEITDSRLLPTFDQTFTDSQELIDKAKLDSEEEVKHIHARIQVIISGVCEILRIISTVSNIGVLTEDDNEHIFELREAEHMMVVWTHPVFTLFRTYTGMTNRAVTNMLRYSIKDFVDLLLAKNQTIPTLFASELKPTVPDLSIYPNLDNLQQTLNEVVRAMLRSTKKIATWPLTVFEPSLHQEQQIEPQQDKPGDQQEEDELLPANSQDYRPRDYFNYLSRDNTAIAMLISVTNKMHHFDPMIKNYIDNFKKLTFLWDSDFDVQFEEFEAKNPTIREIKEKMEKFLTLENTIEEMEPKSRIGPILMNCESVKTALMAEAKKWKQKYGDLLNKIGRNDMMKLSEFMEKMKNNLSKGITQLEDLRSAMESLKKVRNMAAKFEIKMAPIEESYQLLAKYNVVVPQEEIEQFEGLTYNWNKLQELEHQQQEILQKVSPSFKNQVVEGMEQFLVDFQLFLKQYHNEGPMSPGLSPSDASERLKIFQHQFDNIQKRWTTFSGGQELFGLPRTELPELADLSKQLRCLNQLYGLYNEVNSYTRGIRDVLWVDVKFNEIEPTMTEFQSKARRLPNEMKTWQAYIDLQNKIDNFVDVMVVLEALSNPAVQECHWKQIIELTGCDLDIDPDVFRLGHVFDAGLLDHKEDIHDICNAAEQEAKILTKLHEIECDWQSTEFTFANFKDMKDILLKGAETNEIVTKIEDSIVVLSSLNSNRFVGRFKKDVELWMKKLTTSSTVINEWLQVQSMWIYLEAVFSGGDIAKYMTHETKAFSQINKNWMTVMKNANDIKNVIAVCYGDEGLQKLFVHLLEQLQKCQKALAGYIEKKRAAFPRFYFVSDPVILEILGQASNPQAIQPHLQSIFANLVHLDFDSLQYNKILKMRSEEGEQVTFSIPFLAQGNVEVWLNDLVSRMRQTVRDICTDMGQKIITSTTQDWVFGEFPKQVLLLEMMLWWTYRTEEALTRASAKNRKAMNECLNEFDTRFRELIKVAGSLDKSNRLVSLHVEVLITLFLHNLDIFKQLVAAGINNPRHFDWQKQMRYYWQVEGRKCIVSITDVDREYSYEYLGCTSRLVITPLTDRCYITLAQALGLSMGGAPAGPAGTGKTETVKDMSKALGIMCVVFNCSDQMNYQALGRIFRGLAQAGVWGDFDEFNRIELDVLSVAAQQVACVFNACRERLRIFRFTDGSMVELDNRVAIFITMNPGYAGRQELPENLKIQFRMVAMMVPDKRLIMKVKLASSGFSEYEILSDKFSLLYTLCSEQLSKQVHYDWGLRNILSVLRFSKEVRAQNPTMDESRLLMKVLKNMNLSKLVDDDDPLYVDLLNDVFPNTQLDSSTNDDIRRAIIHNAEAAGLDPFDDWLTKVMQLFETCEVRHGIMILGHSGTGKSAIINTLVKALSDERGPHRVLKMNPKAITSSQMFGILDPSSNDWTDGIFSSLWRFACKKTNENVWIGLDGPVDAIWIENLNSVLDDNKTLTLANGDRLPMPNTVKLLFEMSSLDNASPATVSRAGMIYVPSNVLGWRPIAQSWIRKEDFAPIREVFNDLITPLDDVFNFVLHNIQMVMHTSQVHIITTILHIFESLISTRDDDGYLKLTVTEPELLNKLMIFSTLWAFGGFLDGEGRIKLSQHMWALYNFPNTIRKDQLFDYVVDKTTGEWQNWEERLQPYLYPKGDVPEFATILVPTIDNIRIEYLLSLLAHGGTSVLLIGDSGTAKTATINTFLSTFNKDQWVTKTFNFSSATTPYLFQTSIESIIEKTIGTTFGPIGGKKMEVFIDDISMPQINEWGDQVTNEIVRQLMEDGGFYSLEKPGEFTTIIKTQFLAAMCTPGGGRNDIPDRLKRHFSVFNCIMPDAQSINRIYSTIIEGYFIPERGFNPLTVAAAGNIVRATHEVWSQTKAKMLPTPTKFHYVFNLRDLSRIVQGIIQVTTKSCNSPEQIVSLWANECFRVIPDKFVSQEDKDWFAGTIVRVGTEVFGTQYEQVLTDAPNVLFCSFMTDIDYSQYEDVDESKIPRIYEEVSSFDALSERCMEFMREHNAKPATKGKKLDLVLFEDAMNHLVRISRIIGMPRGNAMLVGVGGSGKQSLTRLASTILGYQTFQVSPGRSYSTNDFLADLRELYRRAGVLNKPITFIFTDNEVKEESFLEYVNNMLTTGEIANLFTRDNYEALMADMRTIFVKEVRNAVDTDENVWNYFIDRVKHNLHVVLCFSPVGEQFRKRNLKFPGLFNGCTIDWFTHWPREGLVSVARSFVQPLDIATQVSDLKDRLAECFADIHESVHEGCEDYFSRFRRRTFVTPKSYLSFLSSFKSLYFTQLSKIQGDASRMKEGLEKIREAKDQVAVMKGKLIEQENQLHVAQQNAEQMLEGLTVKRNEAEQQRQEVQLVKEEQQREADAIRKIQEEAQLELELAEPALKRATEALDSIKASDIVEIAGYAMPAYLIKRIIDGVLILRYMKLDPYVAESYEFKSPNGPIQCPSITPSWQYGQPMMKSSDFLKSLSGYNLEFINEEICDLLQPYLSMIDFNPQCAALASNAAAGLCSWVRNMVEYHQVEKVVRPKKLAASIAQANLIRAQADLAKIEEQLAEKEQQLATLQKSYDDAIAEQHRFKQMAEGTQKKLQSAQALIDALSGEKGRWETEAEQLNDMIFKTVGNATMGAAFNSYCGMFNHTMRRLFLNDKWPQLLGANSIPSDSNIDIIALFANEAVLDLWQLQGLPSDELSRQNGVICTNAPTYPLLIDPQGQAHKWITNRHKADGLIITSFDNRYFKTHVENALQDGKPLLIEDCGEEIDPLLDNVLAKNYIQSGRLIQVSLAGREVIVSDGFKMYFTTKLANPHFAPETFAKTAVIEFSVTQFGLEEQLLNLVILREKENLENERQRLLEQVAALRKTLLDLENLLLEQLRSSQGNLLENTTLITTLASTKQKSQENKESLASAMETNQKINKSREDYRPVAVRGAVIYFLIQEMSLVNPMYQVSLNQFLGKFYESIETAEKDNFPLKRIENIIKKLTFTCWSYIIRGLYEKDKLLFCLQLALKIEMSLDKVDKNGNSMGITFNDYQIYIKAGSALPPGASSNVQESFGEIFDPVRDNLIALSQVSSLRGILNYISTSQSDWGKLLTSPAPEQDQLPVFSPAKESDIKPFQRAVIIRCLRPDRAIFASTKYIQEFLGDEYIEYPSVSLDNIASEAGNNLPVIFLLSPGSDPTPLIEEAARKAKKELNTVSMGQGREEFADNFITQSKHKGEWVLLQNCHLGLRYMDTLFEMYKADALADSQAKKEANVSENKGDGEPNTSRKKSNEKQVTSNKPQVTHEDYRLWITTEVHPKFPISLLQLSLKLTNEPPAGAKASMKRTISSISQQSIDTVELPEWRRLIYVLAFFNTTVQERRKFGPLGWAIPYEFNHSDFTASLAFMSGQIVDAQMKGANKGYDASFWQTVRYGVCEIHYGGRVTDELDRRLIKTIGEIYFDNSKIVQDEHKDTLSFDGRGEYTIIDCNQVQAYIQHINTMPSHDPPDVFGLHPLADVKLRRDQANEIFQKIIDIQPKESAVGGMTREDLVLQKIKELLPGVPRDFSMERVRSLVSTRGKKPLDICCKQEIERMQVVLTALRTTLTDLELAIDGSIVMNDQLYNSMNSIYDGRIPDHWKKISWPAENLKDWFEQVKLRYDQYAKWIETGRLDSFWLGGMFNPGGFLTSLRQSTCRSHGASWSLNDTFLQSEVQSLARGLNASDKDKDGPKEFVYLRGLYLEGARWGKGMTSNQQSAWGLTELQTSTGRGKQGGKPVTDLRNEMPLIKVWAVKRDQKNKENIFSTTSDTYVCPVYKNSTRTDLNYVFDIPLKSLNSNIKAKHWVLRGVCITTI